MSNLLHTLPSTYRSHPVIPYAPNADADRAHEWDWTGRADTIASGLTTASVDPTFGTEAITLGYSGLTRADARAIESFVNTQAGRKTGFWCPTFQRDFYVNSRTSTSYSDSLAVREWGYSTLIYPLDGAAFHHFAAYRNGAGLSTPWGLCVFDSGFSAGTPDSSGIPVVNYVAASISFAGDSNVWGLAYGGSNPQNANGGLMLSRLNFVRFADDAITTEWSHPTLAAITLRVISVPGEAP